MPKKNTPGGRNVVIAAREHRKRELERARLNRQRRAKAAGSLTEIEGHDQRYGHG